MRYYGMMPVRVEVDGNTYEVRYKSECVQGEGVVLRNTPQSVSGTSYRNHIFNYQGRVVEDKDMSLAMAKLKQVIRESVSG